MDFHANFLCIIGSDFLSYFDFHEFGQEIRSDKTLELNVMSMYEYDDARASIALATEIRGVASRHSFEMSDQQHVKLEDFAFLCLLLRLRTWHSYTNIWGYL